MSGRTFGSVDHRGGKRLLAALTMAALLGLSLFQGAVVMAAGALSISIVDSPDPVQSGSQIMYTITVGNGGGASVDNAILTDQFSGMVGFGNPPLLDVTSTRGTCTQNNTQVTCNGGTIGGGGNWVVTIRGIVTAAGGTTLNNQATVTNTKSAQTYTTSASATTQVNGTLPGGQSPDLTIAKNGPLSAAAGGPITYTMTINNIGDATAQGVKVVDTLPNDLTGIAATGTSLFTCGVAGKTVTCTGGQVNAGANATITVTGTVSGPGPLVNTSVVDPDDTIDEGIIGDSQDYAERNNQSNTVTTAVSPIPPPPSGPFTIDKVKVGGIAGVAVPGELIKYRVTVTNGTLGRADYVTMTDTTQGLQAASITVTSATSGGAKLGCTVSGPTVKCSVTRMGTNETMVIELQGMVIASAGSTIINNATVDGNVKNKGYAATDQVQTTIKPGYDLTISKSDSPDPVCAGSFPGPAVPPVCRGTGTPPGVFGGLTYTLVVGNSGILDAADVVVRDPLPAGMTYDSAVVPAGWSCVGPSNVVTCHGPIAHESVVTLFILTAVRTTTGSITNTATVDPGNAVFEADETNNISTQSTTIRTGIDLTVAKFDSPPESPEGFDPIATSGTQTYTIIVDNIGTQDATGIAVRDTLPAGTIFLSAVGDHGFNCQHNGASTGGVVDCVGGHILGTRSEFYPPAAGEDHATIIIKVLARPNVGTMHNVVRVDPDGTIDEVNEANNLAAQDTTVGTGDAGQGAFNQLKITKTQIDPIAGSPVATNGTLIYNLHVENAGTDPVSNVVVKDFLPAGTRFIEARDAVLGTAAFFCSHDGAATGGVVTCTGGDFSGSVNTIPGVLTSRDITVKVFAPNTPGTYANLATVDPDNIVPEGNEFDNNSTVNTTVTVGGNNMFNELTITKTQTDPAGNQVATSSVVTYHLDISNLGTNPAFGVRVIDTLPTGFTFLSALDTSPAGDPFRFVCTPGAGNTIDCSGAALSGTPNGIPGEPTSRTIEVKARSSAVPGNYTNTAVADPANTIPEGNEANNAAQAPTTVRVGGPQGFTDLTVTKSASPSVLPGSHATPRGLIVYTITATNAGTDPAFNVKVQDTLPAGTTFVSAVDKTTPVGPDPNDFSCTHSGGVVNCIGATLDGSLGLAGVPTSRIITIVVRAPNENIQGLTNQVRIDPDNTIAESNEINNSASAVTDVQSDINLTITKTGPKSAHQNDITQYVLVVSNTGTAAARGVVVTDPLPVGLIPFGSVQATPGNFACQVLENPVNVVSCVGDLNGVGDPNNFDQVTITIPVFITASGGTLDNQACVDPNDVIVESIEFDNCSENLVPVTNKAPNLLINKSVDKPTLTAGDSVTYTLSVSNNGDADAAGPVTVTDTLPATADFVSVNPDAAFTCAAPVGTVLTCTATAGLTVGQSAQITILMTVNSPLPAGTTSIVNQASVSAGTCSGAGCEDESVDPARLMDNSATVTSSVGGSAIDLVMVNGSTFDTPDPVIVGQKLTYKVTVTNAGSASTSTDPAPNLVVVRLTLPAGLDLDSAAASGGFTCTPSGATTGPVGNVDCTGTLAPGDSTIVTVTTVVTASAGTSLSVTATADPADDIAESNEGNNTKTAITSVVAAPCTSCIDLVAGSIIATPPSPVLNNTDVTYNFAVTNVGDQPTTADPIPHDLVVTIDLDTIFQESTPVSVSAPGFTCITTTYPPAALTVPEFICTSTTGLAGGAGTLFSVVAHVNTGSPAPANFVDFDVRVDPANVIAEFNPANNDASLTIFTHP